MVHKAPEVAIPNIDFVRTFNLRYEDEDVHCGSLAKLAGFFGHDMRAHRHDRVFQLHLVRGGELRLHLDDQFYHTAGPAVFITPPSVPHAFILSENASGYVLSIRQQLVWQLFRDDPSGKLEQCLGLPVCLSLSGENADAASAALLDQYFMLTDKEFDGDAIGREMNLVSLSRLIFTTIARLCAGQAEMTGRIMRQQDVLLFRQFNELVEAHFCEHWTLKQYAEVMRLTESRLNDICRRLANVSSKRLVHERLLQEAKRRLLFSSVPVMTVAYDLGFRDVAYFSRFFRQHAGQAPGVWREHRHAIDV